MIRSSRLASTIVFVVITACSDNRSPFEPGDAPPSEFAEGGSPSPGTVPGSAPTPIDVIITADNAYSFGWGDESKIATYYDNPPAKSAQQIFDCPIGVGPEAYTVPAKEALPGTWLYVVSWADYSVTQGVIGQFKRRGGDPIYTGAGDWQVCAVGIPYPSNTNGPNQATVNDAIAACTAGTGDRATSSAGWVGTTAPITPNAIGTVAFGQDNKSDEDMRGEPGYAFPPVCKRDVTHDNQGIDGDARWMWYAPTNYTPSPFFATGRNDTRTFLIFRFPTRAIPEPVPPK